MGKLLDNIKNAALRSKQPQGQLGGATEATAQSMRTSTGKAHGGGPSGLSNVQEQLGIAQQQNQQAEVTDALSAQAVQAGVTEEQQAVEQQKFDVSQKMNARENDQQYQAKVDGMYNNLQQNYDKMDQQEKEMAMEQLTFDNRLSNEQYINDLQDRGNRMRLDDANAFDMELKKQIMGDNLALLEKDYDNRLHESSLNDTFTLQQAQENIAFAMKMFNADAKDAADAQMYGGLGDLASAAVEGGVKYANRDTTTITDGNPNTGAGGYEVED